MQLCYFILFFYFYDCNYIAIEKYRTFIILLSISEFKLLRILENSVDKCLVFVKIDKMSSNDERIVLIGRKICYDSGDFKILIDLDSVQILFFILVRRYQY